jgi:hypothetical protein
MTAASTNLRTVRVLFLGDTAIAIKLAAEARTYDLDLVLTLEQDDLGNKNPLQATNAGCARILAITTRDEFDVVIIEHHGIEGVVKATFLDDRVRPKTIVFNDGSEPLFLRAPSYSGLEVDHHLCLLEDLAGTVADLLAGR